MHLCSKGTLRVAVIRSTLTFAAVLFVCSAVARGDQAQTPAPASPTTASQPAQPPDYTHPQPAPSLTVDRDPVRSPDGEPTGANPAITPPGGLTRGGSGQFTLQRDVEEVVLPATVIDDHGRMVDNLQKDNFKVYEDNVQQTIAAFQHQDIPISLAILIDNSGSMRTKRQAVNTAALDLVKASNPQDESMIVNFADEAYQDTDLTSNIKTLQEGLVNIDSKGGTALYDAVIASADYLSKNAKRSKQVILIITDGEDNASGSTLEETVRRIQNLQGPVVYSIGLLFDDSGGGREARRAKRALDLLSYETGGVSYFPKSLAQVDDVAHEVASDIRGQYTISYHSTKPASAGGYRTIKLEAKAKGAGKLTVRTRSGYFPKGSSDTAPAPSHPAASR
jgi:VWFA-related protein